MRKKIKTKLTSQHIRPLGSRYLGVLWPVTTVLVRNSGSSMQLQESHLIRVFAPRLGLTHFVSTDHSQKAQLDLCYTAGFTKTAKPGGAQTTAPFSSSRVTLAQAWTGLYSWLPLGSQNREKHHTYIRAAAAGESSSGGSLDHIQPPKTRDQHI